jgi:hypothetical protein
MYALTILDSDAQECKTSLHLTYQEALDAAKDYLEAISSDYKRKNFETFEQIQDVMEGENGINTIFITEAKIPQDTLFAIQTEINREDCTADLYFFTEERAKRLWKAIEEDRIDIVDAVKLHGEKELQIHSILWE